MADRYLHRVSVALLRSSIGFARGGAQGQRLLFFFSDVDCVILEQNSNRALPWLLNDSNTCAGQVLDFSNTSSCPFSPFRLVSAGSKGPRNSAKLSVSELKCARLEIHLQQATPNEDSRQYGVFWPYGANFG